ncbi:MAG TPA: HD domain-containing protein [Candidatus Obscuribacterales bacterium]
MEQNCTRQQKPSLDERQNQILESTEAFVKEKLGADATGHDWWHIHRVRMMAGRLAEEEKVDVFVVELAALLHDIQDWKFHGGDITACSKEARRWLESQAVDEEIIAQVSHIIDNLSYKGAGVHNVPSSLEGMIVQDADRLDAIGAIGIARTFAYGGRFERPLYDPDSKPTLHNSFEEYKKAKGSTINHFYEKLLLLKERMNTPSARRIAEERHAFVERFLEQFFAEWNGVR